MPALDRSATVARIVTESPATARVFQKHRIDYCCHGDATVTEACRERSLDPEAVFAELEAVPSRTGEAAADDPRALPTSALVARIVARHHGYLRRALPSLEPLVAKVAAVHGGRNAKLGALRAAYRDLSDALEPHLRQEEEVLFPALTSPRPDPGLIRDELEAMHSDHLLVGALLERIRESTDGFATPDWGCGTYRFAMQELGALEEDVLRHAHVENHVLMPRFIAPPVATD
jgi:regulator of cell morphogenesis and NO signaling